MKSSPSSLPRALMGVMFFPRGGSALVNRALATQLPSRGWGVTVVSGSLRSAGPSADAARYYSGVDVRPFDYSQALESEDPLRAEVPMHPSYEDRDEAADRVFAAVDDATFEHLTDAWARKLADAGAHEADVLHLHHLTPLHEAAERIAPEVPRITHIHGTELLMLEEIDGGNPAGWPHAGAWAERMRAWAQRSERLIILSSRHHERIERLLGVETERCEVIGNGFDPDRFDRRDVARSAHWRRALVEQPRGWRPGEPAGSVRYGPDDLASFDGEGPVVLYVGRFTRVKRVALLIAAHTRAQRELGRGFPLVLVGGYPGEWEDEHPAEAIQRLGARNVFLAGWHDHAELPEFFAASDVVVLPSVCEQFGLVLVEGMACGLPAIAVDNHGPADIVDDGETGWLCQPDDEASLTRALLGAATDPAERRRRGEAAHGSVRERYSWPALIDRVADLYDEVSDRPGRGLARSATLR